MECTNMQGGLFKSSPLDKMATISQTFSDEFSWKQFFCFLTNIALRFVAEGPIDKTQHCFR